MKRKVHRGRYLLCRTATLPIVVVGITFAVLDPNGDAVALSIYNYPVLPISHGRPVTKNYDTLFPLGTILIIKEPYCKNSSQGDSALIRVDTHTDVVVLGRGDPRLEGVKWRGVGGGSWEPARDSKTVQQYKDFGNKVCRYTYINLIYNEPKITKDSFSRKKIISRQTENTPLR